LAQHRAQEAENDFKALKEEEATNDREKADKDRTREALIIKLETETKFQKEKIASLIEAEKDANKSMVNEADR
jgi:hypothetical protein